MATFAPPIPNVASPLREWFENNGVPAWRKAGLAE
jgi:hypothetical protein